MDLLSPDTNWLNIAIVTMLVILVIIVIYRNTGSRK